MKVWPAIRVFFPAVFHQISELLQFLNDITHSGAEYRNLGVFHFSYDFLEQKKKSFVTGLQIIEISRKSQRR